MSRRHYRYAMVDGVFTEVGNYGPEDFREVPRPVHGVSQDSMPPTWHPCDGEYYDSKSEYRRVTRENGCYEIGNEKLTPKPRTFNERENEAALGRAFQKACQEHNL